MTRGTTAQIEGSMATELLEAEVQSAGAIEQLTRGEVDVQIATAKRYPRSIKSFINTALEMATLDEETAEACFYALPRDGKTVEGPSARLAEICASAWGNMRAQARVVHEDERFVTALGQAWDIQNNVAIGFEVKRRITNRAGKKYNDDMVGVTGNAASSIALRNAVFKVIPSAFWRPIYLKCREVAVGTSETLGARRVKMLGYFLKMGVTNDRVFAVLGVKGIEDVSLEHIATLKGLATAIKDGDTSVDEAFAIQVKTQKPAPEGFDECLQLLTAATASGADAFSAAWLGTRDDHRRHLMESDPAKFEALKAAALAVVTPS